MYYKLVISETGRNFLKEEPHIFNEIIEMFSKKEDIDLYLLDRYGKKPNGRKKIYVDTKDGKPKVVGFLHSFWNQDVSHNSKKWYQTDWICVSEVNEKPLLLHKK
jgi:hypothetical protein